MLKILRRELPEQIMYTNNTALLWHRRLGHTALSSLHRFFNARKLLGVHFSKKDMSDALKHVCSTCSMCKQTRKKFGKSRVQQTTRCWERIYMDLSGEWPLSLHGHKYILTLTDEFSRFTYAIPIKKKSDVYETVKKFLSDIKIDFPHANPTSVFFTDNGREFVNKDVEKLCRERNITHLTTAPYSPSCNGIAERINRTIREYMTSTLYQSNLPKSFWPFALSHAMYVKNRLPHASTPDKRSPYEVCFRHPPKINHIRTFGCKCYVLKLKHERKHKLDFIAAPGIFIGIPQNSPVMLSCSRTIKF